jgi:hypothetical protein
LYRTINTNKPKQYFYQSFGLWAFYSHRRKNNVVTEERRKLHNQELNNLYSSPTIVRVIKSRKIRWSWHVARMGEGRVEFRVVVGKPERKILLGRPRRRWDDNIKMDLHELECGVWTGLSWLRIETGGGNL